MSDIINRQSLLRNIRGELVSLNDEVGIPRTDLPLIRIIAKVIHNEPEGIVQCKECTHFHYDYWSDVKGVPLIVGHEICDFWGQGCKTKEDGFCAYGDRRREV